MRMGALPMSSLLLLLAITASQLLTRCVEATYIACASAAGSNVVNVQVCPQGQCCGVNGYCGSGQGYCGQGNCLMQCPSATTTSAPPPPPLVNVVAHPPPPPQYYYGVGSGSNIADLEYHDYHHHHHRGLDYVWRIVGIVAAILALILLACILILLIAKSRRHKHLCECDHL